MQLRKKVISAIAGLALLTAIACDPSPTAPGGGGGVPDKRPIEATDFDEPNPGQQPAPPAADPGPQNEPGHARMQVIWVGERSGTLRYSIGGAEQAKACPQPTKEGDGKYRGDCYVDIVTIPGNTIGMTWAPSVGGMFAQCVIYALNEIKDYQHVQGGPCAASWRVPA